jgi:hypothetical protein
LPVLATPITFTFAGIGSGSLGSTSFTDAEFKITALADTDDVSVAAGSRRVHRVFNATALVSISGVGDAEFTMPTISVANQNTPAVGFSDPGQDLAILFANLNPAFATYNLRTAMGPTPGVPTINDGEVFATTLGEFVLDEVSTVSFEAVGGVVSEPTALLLICVGLAGVAAVRRGSRTLEQVRT